MSVPCILTGQAENGKRSARFIVGTSTAGWTAADVDYLCDGIDDQVEINAAIQALPNNGGEIVILDGTYSIAANVEINKNNVTLSGNSKSTILKRMFNATEISGLIHVTSNDNAIQNFIIDGNRDNYTSGSNSGIYLDSSNENTITGITCRNNYYGVYLASSGNSVIIGNILNNNHIGIYLHSSIGCTIVGNTCNNNNANGISLYSSTNIAVNSNICNNNKSGITLTSSSTYDVIVGNTCNSNSYQGIGLASSCNFDTITGNICNYNQDGISLLHSSNDTINGNTCNANGTGVTLNLSSSSAIVGNTCYNNNYGIELESSHKNTITGNICIRSDGVPADYTSSQYTIRIRSGIRNLFVGNNLAGKNYVDEGATNTWANNKYE